MLNKRLIILISAIAGIFIIAGFVLWLVFRTPTEKTITEETPEEIIATVPITPPKEGEFTIFNLSDTAVLSPAISGNKALYYSKLNGNVLETDFEGGSSRTVTNISIPNLLTAAWSYDKSKAINIYQENGTIKKVLFDFSTQKAVQLDSRIKFVNFAQNKDKIAYQFIDESLGTNKIAIADSNGLNWKNIFSTRAENLKIYWPSENTVAFATSPSGLALGSAFTKKIDDESSGLTKTISDAFGLTIKYSPDGSRLLYSKTDQFGHNPSLHLIRDGGSAENLNLSTLSDKCVFSQNNNIYCAVPKIINGSLVLPDDFYKNTANFSDVFFKIDASANRSSILLDPADFKYDFNASDIQISPNEDYLVFINKKDGLLYSVKIK